MGAIIDGRKRQRLKVVMGLEGRNSRLQAGNDRERGIPASTFVESVLPERNDRSIRHLKVVRSLYIIVTNNNN